LLGETRTTEYVRHDVEIPVCDVCAEAHAIQKSFDTGMVGWLVLLFALLFLLSLIGVSVFVSNVGRIGKSSDSLPVAIVGIFVGAASLYGAMRVRNRSIRPRERKLAENSKGSLAKGAYGAAKQVLTHPEVRNWLSKKTCFLGWGPEANNDSFIDLAK
jgi:hypothetical protein